MSVRPERLAAAARAMQRALLGQLAACADELVAELARDEGMVAWDREQLLGRVQRDLQALRERRFAGLGGSPVRVVERRRQPLECIAVAWEQLRRGRRVAVEGEPGTSLAGLAFLHEIGRQLGEEWLRVGLPDSPLPEEMQAWPEVGVQPATERVALVQADADPELAAYLLARACLRRSGFDPRGVHHAVVVEPSVKLEPYLRRLWVGARMGSAADHGAFAGPVHEEQARRFEADLRGLQATPGVATLVHSGRLEHATAAGVCLAPALLTVDGQGPGRLGVSGPVLLLHRSREDHVESVLRVLTAGGAELRRVGKAPRGAAPGRGDRQYDGALLLERIPPGLPKPRP